MSALHQIQCGTTAPLVLIESRVPKRWALFNQHAMIRLVPRVCVHVRRISVSIKKEIAFTKMIALHQLSNTRPGLNGVLVLSHVVVVVMRLELEFASVVRIVLDLLQKHSLVFAGINPAKLLNSVVI